MAITLRAAGTVATGTTSVAVSRPTGTSTGDLLVAYILDHATSGSTTAPTGWTRQGGVAGTGGRFQVFTAIVGSGGLTGTSWTWSSLTTRSEGVIVGFIGVDSGVPLDVAVSARLNASGTVGTTSITPVSANNMVVSAYAALASGSTLTSPTLATGPTIAQAVYGANSTFCAIEVANGVQSVAGATGVSSITMGTAGANAAILLSLKPAAKVTLTGATSSSAAGTVTKSADGGVSLSGALISGVLGVLVASAAASVTLSGAASSSSSGFLTASGLASVSVTGATSAALPGINSASGDAEAQVSGSSNASFPGNVVSQGDSSQTITGVSGQADSGLVAATGFSGVSANVDVSGSSSTAFAGVVVLSADGTSVIEGSSVEAESGSDDGPDDALLAAGDADTAVFGTQVQVGAGSVSASVFVPTEWMYEFVSSSLIDMVGNDIYPDEYRSLAAGLVQGRLISTWYAGERKDLQGWINLWTERSPEFARYMEQASPIPPKINNSV